LVGFFMIMADQLENRTAIGAGKAIETLIRATPGQVHLIQEDGEIQELPTEDLKVSQLIQVRPGEVLPIDGIIHEGESSFDESSITGESIPVDKNKNGAVYAGTTNLTGVISVKVEKCGEDTTVGKVKKLIYSAADSKLPVMSIIEKNAGWYTPLIVMLAAVVYFVQREEPDALSRAITILIIACPCSLILATPSVMIAAITAAARAGVLIKNVVNLEHFHQVEHIFFDKTGTLTKGEMTLEKMSPLGEKNKARLLQVAGSIASGSNHPNAKGVHQAMLKANIHPLPVSQVSEIHGKGMKAQHNDDEYFMGRPEWVKEQCNTNDAHAIDSGTCMALGSKSLGLLGIFYLSDQLRQDAANSLDELKKYGIKQCSLLTGDAWEPARKAAKELKLDQVFAKCLPEQKLEQLQLSKNAGYKTAVVGDGINDAPILAASDVGIAMGALGSQVAIESASITLMSSNMDRLPFLHRLSRSTRILIWTNMAIGVSVLILGLFFSVLGIVSPVLAAIIHNVSALIILFNSARLVKMTP
ncbi:MAG: cadmium-translocating P-type ATPase, partial [Planctomycetes bacterium]|nr:cadmium-translocating P-type ATPase [Planctomycetota bacterium]